MMSPWTVAAREFHGGYKQSCVGFWHWPSNPKKQFGVYKPRLSCAQLWCAGQRAGVRMLRAMCWRASTGSDPRRRQHCQLQSLKWILKVPNVVKVFRKCQTPCLVSVSFFVYQTLQPHSSAPSSLLHLSQSLKAPGKLRIGDHRQKIPQPRVDLMLLEDFPRMERAVGLGQEDMGWMPRPAHQGVQYKANPKGAAELAGD